MISPTDPACRMQHEFLSEHFINRELSWLEFNSRVLEEAQDPGNPLLERVKYLSICSSNLDEFFMVRVAGLREQGFGDGAPQDYAPDGLRPVQQLARISGRVRQQVEEQYRCWNELLLPELEEERIRFVSYGQLNHRQRAEVDQFFEERAYPILTPMAIDPSHPSPGYHNRGLYIAANLRQEGGLGPKRLFAVVQLPQILPRLVQVSETEPYTFIFLEEILSSRMTDLFGGFEILCHTTFRITRDNDLELMEQESDDMLRLIEERLKARQRAGAVRLEVSAGADPEMVTRIVEDEKLQVSYRVGDETYSEIYTLPGPLDFTALMALHKLPGKDHLRDVPFSPQPPRGGRMRRGPGIFDAIAQRDILLHHPYDSFAPVTDFIHQAAEDPHVLAIKQTLYRTGGDSPIIKALMRAAENGKHVTALVELKARFDEAVNVSWARQLERAGVHVVFGFLDLKTHCKLSLVVRQEGDVVRRYVHLSTGNYNATTALAYTDLGLFTTDWDIAEDASALFNLLTGYSQGQQWRKLIVAPIDLHRRTVELIEEQAELARAGKPSWIFAKCNSLVDHRVIEALYRASQAGVPIELVIRGICCLRPGIPGISETIRVRSIVDRFLEHSRIYIFSPGDESQVFLSSADWMPRNFFRRVESMFPVEAPELRDRILKEIVPAYLCDNVRARLLRSDGSYERATPEPGQPPFRCQEALLQTRFSDNGFSELVPESLRDFLPMVSEAEDESEPAP